MGAPNIVRGGSHSGNVAARQLAGLGLLDILSSDYYPASLLDAAFRLVADERNALTLPQAAALVTRNPARALDLQDRGTIAEGLRADLVLARTASTVTCRTCGARAGRCSDGAAHLSDGALRLR